MSSASRQIALLNTPSCPSARGSDVGALFEFVSQGIATPLQFNASNLATFAPWRFSGGVNVSPVGISSVLLKAPIQAGSPQAQFNFQITLGTLAPTGTVTFVVLEQTRGVVSDFSRFSRGSQAFTHDGMLHLTTSLPAGSILSLGVFSSMPLTWLALPTDFFASTLLVQS